MLLESERELLKWKIFRVEKFLEKHYSAKDWREFLAEWSLVEAYLIQLVDDERKELALEEKYTSEDRKALVIQSIGESYRTIPAQKK